MKQKKKQYKPNTAISEYDLGKRFPDAESARLYIEQQRWHGNVACPHCNSTVVSPLPSKSGFWHCSGCRKQFSAISGTIFHNSQIPLDKWLLAFYFFVTDRKGISSMALSKKIGVTQKSAWHMCHRIRDAAGDGKYDRLLKGIVEVDEVYIGGKNKNRHAKKKLKGSGPVNKATVFGARERGTGRVISIVAKDGTRPTLQGLVEQVVEKNSIVSTDETPVYDDLPNVDYIRVKVKHKAKQFVDGMASTNGIESVWALLKRGYYGTFHNFTLKYMQRYVNEFDFRLNQGNCKYPTMQRIDSLLSGGFGKRLPWKKLVEGERAYVYSVDLGK